MFVGLRWENIDVDWLAVEEIGHDDEVIVWRRLGGENICALKRLREESEDVEDVEDGFRGILVTCDV